MEEQSVVDTPWFYLDPKSRDRKGPMPTSVIKRLLEKGLLGLDATTQVWQAGMDQWKAVVDVPELRSIVEFQSMQWYYLDSSHQQKGPIFSRFLVHKLKEGELDGLSLVYGGKYSTWMKISEIPELKEAMQKIALEEEALEQARSNDEKQEQQKQDALLIAQQTYVPLDDDLVQPTYDKSAISKGKTNISNDTQEQVDSSAPKYFEDDHGNKYKWDNDEQDWVVMEDEEEDEFLKYMQHQKEQGSNGSASITNKDSKAKLSGTKRPRKEDDNNNDDNVSVASHHSGTSDGPTATGTAKAAETEVVTKKRKNSKKKRAPATWIYIEGLPGDITFEELKDHFSKVGLIALNPSDQQPRIKIYRDSETNLCKGDCSICYNAEESVQIALDVFDGGYIRPNFQIKVTRATFDYHAKASTSTSSGGAAIGSVEAGSNETKPQVSKHKSINPINPLQAKVARSAMRAALSWNEDDDSGLARSSALRIVVLEGMFTPNDFTKPGFEEELHDDIASECEKFGVIEKLTVFSKHPGGIIIVKFSTAFAAQECIRVMNGRFFGGRKIKSFYWDGATNYSLQGLNLEEDEKEEEARLEEFGSWLEEEQADLPDEFRLRTE